MENSSIVTSWFDQLRSNTIARRKNMFRAVESFTNLEQDLLEKNNLQRMALEQLINRVQMAIDHINSNRPLNAVQYLQVGLKEVDQCFNKIQTVNERRDN